MINFDPYLNLAFFDTLATVIGTASSQAGTDGLMNAGANLGGGMVAKLNGIWPEITLCIAATLSLFVGMAKHVQMRRMTWWISALGLAVAALIAAYEPARPDAHSMISAGMGQYVKIMFALTGLVLLLVAAQIPETLAVTHRNEIDRPDFDPGQVVRGEFFAFFLLSLAGAMLCGGADDLVWLFLALELTSLPTYVLVATARDRIEAQEAGVKYFFLGALSAAVFLYGFALIYGATGHTDLGLIHQYVMTNGASPMFITGLLLSLLGVAFKIAAFPMHFYVADVYQGANVGVTAYLAFVPKAAGFISLIVLLGLIIPENNQPIMGVEPITGLIWIMAAATMTLGNILALLQNNVKRMLAYSSIAHSGYMLVGLTAGLGNHPEGHADGVSGVLFYLVAYGLATIAVFAVIGCLQVNGEEAETYEDLDGLSNRHPFLSGTMLLATMSMIGLPPMVGFVGKLFLFSTAMDAGFIILVIIAVVNSAVSAAYYLRLFHACFFGHEHGQFEHIPEPADAKPVVDRIGPFFGYPLAQIVVPILARRSAAFVAVGAALWLGVASGWLVNASMNAVGRSTTPTPVIETAEYPNNLPAPGSSPLPSPTSSLPAILPDITPDPTSDSKAIATPDVPAV